jgi:hypothetical protein
MRNQLKPSLIDTATLFNFEGKELEKEGWTLRYKVPPRDENGDFDFDELLIGASYKSDVLNIKLPYLRFFDYIDSTGSPYASYDDLIDDLGTLLALGVAGGATNLGYVPATGEITSSTGTNTNVTVFTGDTGAGGVRGLVPDPAIGDATKFLRGDSTWETVVTGPAGADTQVQVNDNNVQSAYSSFTFDDATRTLGVGAESGAVVSKIIVGNDEFGTGKAMIEYGGGTVFIGAQNSGTKIGFEISTFLTGGSAKIIDILNVNSFGTASNKPLSLYAGSAFFDGLGVTGGGSIGTTLQVNGGVLDSSASLIIGGTDKGILIPRLTTVQKNAIATPATSLQVFDTDLNRLEFYNGSAWKPVGDGLSAGSDTQVQVNDNNVQSAYSSFTFDDATRTLGVGKDSNTLTSRIEVGLESGFGKGIGVCEYSADKVFIGAEKSSTKIGFDITATISGTGNRTIDILNVQSLGTVTNKPLVLHAGSGNFDTITTTGQGTIGGIFIAQSQSTLLGDVSVNGSESSASASFIVTGTDKGILIPRLTTAQRDAIVTPATSLLIFNTDATVPQFEFYDGSTADNRLVKTDGTSRLVQESGITIGDDNTITGDNISEETEKTASFTLTSSNASKHINLSAATDQTLTFPQNSTEALSGGYYVTVTNKNTGVWTIAIEGSDTLEGSDILKENESALIKLDAAGTPQTITVIGGHVTILDNEKIYIPTVADQDYNIVLEFLQPGKITDVITQCESGTCTVTGKINTTAFGGTANAASTTLAKQSHATSNTYGVGDKAIITVSSNAACIGLTVQFNIEYD